MLEQLEKVNGVDAAMANHSGSLVRVSLKDNANPQVVASELTSIFKRQNRKPIQFFNDELALAIRDEQWRTANRIGELSEIEFRTVFAKRVKEYADTGGFDEETKNKLIAFSEQVLGETAASNQDTDWREFCEGLFSRMLEKAKALLTDAQLDALAKKFKSRVAG